MLNKLFENEKYAPLREMEAFTQDMFNRIIDFQEKKHSAWNENLSFEERIKGLPLHYLIFSNADRDPKKNGPSVSHFYPLREEIIKIAHYVNQCSENPGTEKKARLCDYFPENGFVGSLIAREGIQTIGLKNNNDLPNQIEKFYDANAYSFSENEYNTEKFDAVLASWPHAEVNPTPDILSAQPKLIVYIYTEHKNNETGKRQTGTDDMFVALSDDYELIDSWSVMRQKDILHAIWPDMTPSIEENRHVRIYARQSLSPLHPFSTDELTTPIEEYDWEMDLYMTELALEAKRELDMHQTMM